MVSICNFHKGKPIDSRAALLYKENTGNSTAGSNPYIESFKTFLTYAEEFMVFFGENLKFYPYSKFKIKNIFAKELQNYEYKRSLAHFTKSDLSSLQDNSKKRGASFRDELSDFTDFLSCKIE